jgi:hypothetical protein
VTDTIDTQDHTPFFQKKAADYTFADTMMLTAATTLVMSAVPVIFAMSVQKAQSVARNRKAAKAQESISDPENPES